jgi:hypothetical protein
MSGMQREYQVRRRVMYGDVNELTFLFYLETSCNGPLTNPDPNWPCQDQPRFPSLPQLRAANLTTVFLLHYLAFLAVVVVFKTLGTDASIHVPSHCALWCVFWSCWIGTAGWVESRKKWVELGKEWVGLVRRSGMWEKVEVGEAK